MSGSGSWSRRVSSRIAMFVLMVFALDPGSLFGQEIQDGKWKVPTGISRDIFVNGSGATQHVMITVCAVSGGDVSFELQNNVLIQKISVPECVTVRGFVGDGKSARIGNGSGTNASGTYVVTLVPF